MTPMSSDAPSPPASSDTYRYEAFINYCRAHPDDGWAERSLQRSLERFHIPQRIPPSRGRRTGCVRCFWTMRSWRGAEPLLKRDFVAISGGADHEHIRIRLSGY